ncbi:P-loop NTPase family protein [Noviherbaspirillum pedocola]|uniref:ATP-binding protein n=1 Tax=Noviherbaspirillum pedocola TaxID=2801341 RepID=A0A934W4F0_9BURK|nr:ATP-binding protein [Noviherbaspirillum pedocola]MBK4733812.1 ATP-binding protein [Noviherbaspirillum pedocola]
MEMNPSDRDPPPSEATTRMRSPRTIEETGLPFLFMLELIAKILFLRGQIRLSEMASHLCLPSTVLNGVVDFMRTEKLVEALRVGGTNTDADLHYRLTGPGRERAGECLARNAYAGPAPVSLARYCEQVRSQRVADMRIRREDLARVFENIVLDPRILEQLGAAMNSGRAIFIHGPAGSGKTYLAEHLTTLLKGDIWVPHALLVDGEVVQVYDPAIHLPALEDASAAPSLDRGAQGDARWLRCRRPTVLTGGELNMDMFDLHFDPATRYYQAPPHLKANNGLFIIDDLGRQRCSPTDLMNRWIVPLDRNRDFLSLHTGHKFMVPFDVIVVFSSNHAPEALADGAFTRRLGYKIHVGQLTEEEYARIFRQACAQYEVPWSEAAFRYLLEKKHYTEDRPLLACYPRDLVSQARDLARYEGTPVELDSRVLDWAWRNYFDNAAALS